MFLEVSHCCKLKNSAKNVTTTISVHSLPCFCPPRICNTLPPSVRHCNCKSLSCF